MTKSRMLIVCCGFLAVALTDCEALATSPKDTTCISHADTLWKTRPNNRLILELLGTGVLGSLGYERLLTNRQNRFLVARINAGGAWHNDFDVTATSHYSLVALSIGLTQIHKAGKYTFIEYGIALTGINGLKQFNDLAGRYSFNFSSVDKLRIVAASGVLGFRWQRPKSRVFFRVTAYPSFAYTLIEDNLQHGLYFVPTLGLAMGYGFKWKCCL